MASRLVFVHALSALHAGTGQGVGAIDLPIARERATNLPMIPGTSLKGCLKEASRREAQWKDHWEAIFGSQKAGGLLQISDARLLLFPVRCLGATFVWTTSPYLLRRLRRDAEAADGIRGMPTSIPDLAEGKARLAAQDPLVTVSNKLRLVLEDLDFEAEIKEAAAWCDWLSGLLFPGDKDWQAEMKKRFAIIDDKSFHFLADFATEVTAHVEIEQTTGTAKEGHLWYQEALPAETVLIGLARAEERAEGKVPTTAQILEFVAKGRPLQLGGKATTGQGIARFSGVGGGS